MLTADYLGGYGGTYAYPWSAEAPYVNWAKASNVADSDGQRAAGINTYVYTDPNRTYVGSPLYTNDESTFAHTCSGARVAGQYVGLYQYVMDPASPHLLQLWSNSVPYHSHYTAIFEDDTNTMYGIIDLPCNYSASNWLQASVNEARGFGYPLIYNGAAFPGSLQMNQAGNVLGGMSEQCYATPNSAGKTTDSYWQTIENVEIQSAQQGKLFFCLAETTAPGATSIDARTYDLASFLLAYSPTSTILMEFFGTASGFHVEPESQLVPLYPVSATPSDVSGLKTGGVYSREYKACYFAGHLVGACAVAVNPSSFYGYPFPYSGKYTHTLSLSGAGVLDGGSATTLGPPPPAQLAPLGSAIAFQ